MAGSFNADITKWKPQGVQSMSGFAKGANSFTHIWCNSNWATKISDVDFNSASAGKVMCCQVGKFYNPAPTSTIDNNNGMPIIGSCDLCPIGTYHNITHVTDQLPLSCETCPRNTFAQIVGLPACSDCEVDQYRYVHGCYW
jgi:hypothetical protein